MKKILATLSAVAVAAAGALTFSACGSAEVMYSLSEDGTYYILSGVSGNTSALKSYEIPSVYDDGEHGQLPVTQIADEAFMGCSLGQIAIPDSITHIGDRAFAYTYLIRLEIPESVTYIGYAAFAFSSSLQEVTIPSSVTQLGPYAFAYCSSLESAVVNANIDTLYVGTFQGIVANDVSGLYTNTKLTSISLPATLKYLHRDSISGNFLTDIHFAGTADEWEDVQVFYAEERVIEDDEAEEGDEPETEVVTVYLDEEQTIEYFTVEGLTIHCTDYDLVYSAGQIIRTPASQGE